MSLVTSLLRTLFVTLACASINADGGAITKSGREEDSWTKGRLFVIIASVATVVRSAGESEDETHRITLVPHATLAGSFDVSLHPQIVAPTVAGIYGTSIKEPPPTGSLAIVVLCPHDGELWVDSASIAFVPGGSALTVVDGWNDPRIAETLKNIQAARHPTTQPATQGSP